jgi:two-component system, cell cycle sensor histidine kinase and response regulator CckA
VDGEPARGRAHPSARDRLQGACLVSMFAAVIAASHTWLAYPDAIVPVVAGSAAMIGLAGALFAFARRGWIADARLGPCGAALMMGLATMILVELIASRAQLFAAFVPLLMLAAGAVHSNTRWLAIGMAYALGCFLVTGFALFGTDFALAAAGLSIAAAAGLTIHLVNVRYLRNVEEMRARDGRHQAELTAALAAVQRELIDRKSAEAERERLREQLLHAQKLEAIGTLAGGVAHDMNNMLAAIIGLAELLREDPQAGPDVVEHILNAARRGTELTRNLLGFSRRGKYHKETIDLSSVVASVSQLLTRTLPKGITLTGANRATHAVEGDSGQLGQALVNLCLNSADAMEGSGALRIDVGEVDLAGEAARALGLADGRYVTLAVADSGCGMDRETQAHIFEPFFTTKEQGRGTGLGLAMVYGTIANHGGAIAVDSEQGRGTCITLHLPAVELASRPEPVAAPRVVHDGGGALVLVVDDEPMVRAVTRRSLERVGYRVITASDGAEAVERFRERGADVTAVVLDMAMPVMGGAECFRRLRALAPDVPVLIASGCALEQEARDCLAAGALVFLEKPFPTARLLEAMAVASSQARADAPRS